MAIDPEVSIVLPIFNEHGHIEDEINRIARAMDSSTHSYEIIVIDDGSTDGSADVLGEVPGIRLIQYADNRGAGFARKVGTQLARGSIVVWTDVDMSYPNEEIPLLIDGMAECDQVVGARTTEEGTSKLLRVPAKWLIRKFAEFVSRAKIPDLNSGMRAFRREVALQYLQLMPVGFSHVTTLTMSFLANGYSVHYLPIPYSKRSGQSKFHWFADTQRYLLQVTRMAMMYNPMRLFLPVGSLLLTLAVIKSIYDIVTKSWRMSSNTVGLWLLAIAVLIIGLLADLIVQLNKRTDPVVPQPKFAVDHSAVGVDAAFGDDAVEAISETIVADAR